ncbi:unnamed protein product [Gadus morhua 'NCC']
METVKAPGFNLVDRRDIGRSSPPQEGLGGAEGSIHVLLVYLRPPQSREAEGRTAPPHTQGSGHPGHAQIGNHIPSVGQLWKSNSLEASLEG